jgi:hypothetical protein
MSRIAVVQRKSARAQFEPLVTQIQKGKPKFPDVQVSRMVEACANSIPVNVLEQISPYLVKPSPE